MARFYTEISKEEFLNKVETLMGEEYPYKLPTIIKKDLSKVNFDWENYTEFKDGGFALYPNGYMEVSPGFHIFFAQAGGDWEYPVCFIFYWGNGILRAYIPNNGNVWNKKEKCAYGSEENEESEEVDEIVVTPEIAHKKMRSEEAAFRKIERQFSKEKMITEILGHITKK